MKRDFSIFTIEQSFELCEFINGLNNRRRKFTVTPLIKEGNINVGFAVWYHK